MLWEQSYNGRYISTLDNGRGWHENISWNEAHGNTHGASSGSPNDLFACNGYQAKGTTCGTADDHSWSRVVVTSRSSVTNSVTSTWNYQCASTITRRAGVRTVAMAIPRVTRTTSIMPTTTTTGSLPASRIPHVVVLSRW